MSKYKNEILIDSNSLRVKIGKTKSFIVFSGSVEDRWNGIVRKLHNFTDDSFFLGYKEAYPNECGWYLRFEDVKPLLEEIHKEIKNEGNYNSIVEMMGKYNSVIEGINSMIDSKHHLPVLYDCNNNYCIFNRKNRCHRATQEQVEPNKIDCGKSIRADYYEIHKGLKNEALEKVENMNIGQLVKFVGSKEECQEG